MAPRVKGYGPLDLTEFLLPPAWASPTHGIALAERQHVRHLWSNPLRRYCCPQLAATCMLTGTSKLGPSEFYLFLKGLLHLLFTL